MDPGNLDPQGLPRRARSMARMGAPPEQWDGAQDPYARPRSPTRAMTGVSLPHEGYGGDSRSDGMLRLLADEQPAYYDDRAAGGYDVPRVDPRGDASLHNGGVGGPGYGPPGRAGSQKAYGGAPGGYPGPPGGYGGWQGGPPQGWPGGYGDGGGGHGAPYRRSTAPGEAMNQEQWKQIQASLDKQNAAAVALAKRPKAHENVVKEYFGYGMRRLWYLVDSKIGTLKYQVLALVAVAVIISVSGGKVVQLVRDMAFEEGLLDTSTTYTDGVWLAWSLIIDPGFGTWPDEVVGVRMRAVTIIIVIIGILYLSVIIALIVDAVQVKMEELKKARRCSAGPRASQHELTCAARAFSRPGAVARGGDGPHGGAGLGGAVADHHPRAGVRQRQRGRRRHRRAVGRGEARHGARAVQLHRRR